jgi:FMN reductase
MDFENGRSKVVGIGGTLREGSTSLVAHTTDAMVHLVHALRGVVGSLTVAIPKVWEVSDGEGRVTDENYGRRLDRLGRLVVELAEKVSPAHGIRRVETVRIAV